MTLSEKIATVSKLERIDSSIESCIKILEQELEKRKTEDLGRDGAHNYVISSLCRFKDDFNIMKGKK